MIIQTTWRRFLSAQTRAHPLHFVEGWRTPTSPSVYCPFHSHHTLEIVYHRTGRGVSSFPGGHRTHFVERSAILYAPRQKHDQRMKTEGEDLCVHVSFPRRFELKGHLYVEHLEDRTIVAELEFLAKGNSTSDQVDRAILNLRATAAILSILRQAHSRARKTEADHQQELYVQLAEEYVHKNYRSIKSVQEISKHVDISYDHLRHCFKLLRGTSLIHHLNAVRVDRARLLLIHSRLPLKQISDMCGFQDNGYFSRSFRKAIGVSPLQYRRTEDLHVTPWLDDFPRRPLQTLKESRVR